MPNGGDPVERFRTRVRAGDVDWETVDTGDRFYEQVVRDDCTTASGSTVTRRTLLASVLREDCERYREALAAWESPDPALLERIAAIEAAAPTLSAEAARAALDELFRVAGAVGDEPPEFERRRRLARGILAAAGAAGVAGEPEVDT